MHHGRDAALPDEYQALPGRTNQPDQPSGRRAAAARAPPTERGANTRRRHPGRLISSAYSTPPPPSVQTTKTDRDNRSRSRSCRHSSPPDKHLSSLSKCQRPCLPTPALIHSSLFAKTAPGRRLSRLYLFCVLGATRAIIPPQ